MTENLKRATRTKQRLKTLASTSLGIPLLLLACSSAPQLVANAGADTSIAVGTAPHFNDIEWLVPMPGELVDYGS